MLDNPNIGEELEIPGFDFAVDTADAAVLDTQDETPKMSPSSALVVCMNRIGKIDMNYMFMLTGKTPQEIGSVLGGSAIFQDPAMIVGAPNPRDGWVLRETYLSGDLRSKLEIAEDMNRKYPDYFKDNIIALKGCLPEVAAFDQIHLNLDAPWIPADVVSQFIGWLLKLQPPKVSFAHQAGGIWRVEIPAGCEIEYQVSYKNHTEFGTTKISALQIIRNTLNSIPVSVWKETGKKLWEGKHEFVLDKEETEKALRQQTVIMKAFSAWASDNETIRNKLSEAYNAAFSRYNKTTYSGKFLTIEDLAPGNELKEYQKDAVARILLSGSNTLLCHEVGSGKTYVMITAAHLLHKLGLSKKNMVVVPNNILQSTVDLHKKLFPNDKIRMIKPSGFSPSNRETVLEEIRKNGHEFAAIYIAFSSFDLIGISKEFKIKELKDEIEELEAGKESSLYQFEKLKIQSQIRKLQIKLSAFENDESPASWLPYDALGIETLFVDEAHNYKNISIPGIRSGNGITASVSNKAINMLDCVHATPKTVMSTGTPITNSISDVFVFQTFLQPGILQNHSIAKFDTWSQTFTERESILELDMDSTKLKLRNRITSFVNLRELVSMFSLVSDYHENERTAWGEGEFPKYDGPTDVSCPPSSSQKRYIQELNNRVSLVRNHAVDLHEDNLLKITSDGKNSALDLRLVKLSEEELNQIGSNESEFGSKIGLCAENVWENYRDNPGTAQVVFCDIGTPGGVTFHFYETLKEKFVKKGVPQEEIAFVHDAATEAQKVKLFERINNAEIRVCIGSTQRLGVGVNIQRNLCAIHHLSVPWRTADIEQREGRILRQGNRCREVRIYRYITEGSFDAYLFQVLQTKSLFVSSFLSGVTVLKSIEDLGQTVLSYSEVKRLAVDNQKFNERCSVESRLYNARLKSQMRKNEMKDLELRACAFNENIRKIRAQIGMIEEDAAYYRRNQGTDQENGEREIFANRVAACLSDTVWDADHEIGTWHGFRAALPARSTGGGRTVLWLHSPDHPERCYAAVIRTNHPERAPEEIDNVLSNLSERIAGLELDIDECAKKSKAAEEDLAKGNIYAEEVGRLETELEQIDRKLMDSER